MKHLPGAINSSDGLTKAMNSILHPRHALRAMGHYRMVSPEGSKARLLAPHVRAEAVEAGEGVGAHAVADSRSPMGMTDADVDRE